jgi:penicillin-binding protein 1A
MFVNGGKKVEPVLLDRVQDRYGRTIQRGDKTDCVDCNLPWAEQAPPVFEDSREQVLDAITAYQSVSMMEGVVQRGTASRLKAVGKPIAGKTGTTNDYIDAWFVGFSPDLVAAVWVGHDSPKSLGDGESGGRVAAPIFRDFMMKALENTPAMPFRLPSGVRLVEVDAKTGKLPGPDTLNVIMEAFRPGTEPGGNTEDNESFFENLRRQRLMVNGQQDGLSDNNQDTGLPDDQGYSPGEVYEEEGGFGDDLNYRPESTTPLENESVAKPEELIEPEEQGFRDLGFRRSTDVETPEIPPAFEEEVEGDLDYGLQ